MTSRIIDVLWHINDRWSDDEKPERTVLSGVIVLDSLYHMSRPPISEQTNPYVYQKSKSTQR